MITLIEHFIAYIAELWWILLVGFMISGLFKEFIPERFIDRYLGHTGLMPIVWASIIGIILPVCCVGSLPIAVTLRKQGASIGPVLAFLVATPATSVSALFVCWKLLGGGFTLMIFVAAASMAILLGVITNRLKHLDSKEEKGLSEGSCCKSGTSQHPMGLKRKLVSSLEYSLLTLPKEMGREILIGIALASVMVSYEPLQQVIHDYVIGMGGYILILGIGLVTYVCSTASVPIADALVQSGSTVGHALCYLLVGPVTSYSTILVVRKTFGNRILWIYLSVICCVSVCFSLLLGAIS